MEFGALIRQMTQSVCDGDGDRVAACFTEDGVYHDVFYGAFEGRHGHLSRCAEARFTIGVQNADVRAGENG